MKYLNLAIVSIAFLGLALVSCESKAEIDTKNLKTACDHVNALDEILTEMLDLKGTDYVKDLDDDTKAKYKKLKKKLKEVGKAMEEKFEKSEYKECPDYDLAMRKRKDV